MKTNLPLPWTAMRFLSNQLFIQGTFTLSLNNAVIKYHKAAHNIIWELPNATTDSHCQLLELPGLQPQPAAASELIGS